MVDIRKKLLSSDVEELLNACNFSAEEEQIFKLWVKKMGIVQITQQVIMSQRTVERRVHDIKTRVADYWRKTGASST